MPHQDFRTMHWVVRGLVSIVLLGSPIQAAEDDEDQLPVYKPGLVATYRQGDRFSATRIDDDLEFVWRGGESPDERLAAGPFDVAWRGRLHTLAPGDYRIDAFVQGRFELKINGESVLDVDAAEPTWHESEVIKLAFGHHPISVSYSRTGGDGVLKLCWSGPQFGVEPIPERALVHEPKESPPTAFEEGRLLVRALRCVACHDVPGESKPLPAPALTHLEGNLSSDWLVDWLAPKDGAAKTNDPLKRRMPHQSLTHDDAAVIAAYLFGASKESQKVDVPKAKEPPPPEPAGDPDKKKKPKPRKDPSVRAGEQLTHSLGCLACHRASELGGDSLFGGTELTKIADKRSPEFFVRWFNDARDVNSAHRMPQFKLDLLERADLTVYLMTLGNGPKLKTGLAPLAPARGEGQGVRGLVEEGKRLVAEHRCAACHQVPEKPPSVPRAKALTAASNWKDGCLGEPGIGPRRPGYVLDDVRRAAIVTYLSAARPRTEQPSAATDGRFVFVERNCVACHSRGHGNGLADRVGAITAADAELLPIQAALLPPSLNGVGDKLPDAAFLAAVKTERPPLRPWLRVRMPKFNLSEDETKAVQQHLIDHDRVPDRPPPPEASSDDVAQRLAARRLVTADGFGCTSCHKIGKAEPSGTLKLASIGTDLSLVGERIRKPWFDRWVRNPARIIPRMEMPAVQLSVRGVLHDDLNEQLAAVWKVLNEKDFTPPLPNPVRIVRSRNVPGLKEPPHVLTDVFIVDGETYVSPIVIGLPNRHNVLFDLEKNHLAAWWTGDTALERTKGKSWYWEPGGAMVLPSPSLKGDPAADDASDEPSGPFSELYLTTAAGKPIPLLQSGQSLARLDEIKRTVDGVVLSYQVRLDDESQTSIRVRQTFTPLAVDPKSPHTSGIHRSIKIENVPDSAKIAWVLAPGKMSSREFAVHEGGGIEYLLSPGKPRIMLSGENGASPVLHIAGWVLEVASPRTKDFVASVDYLVDLPLDTFPNELPALPNPPAVKLDVLPGFETTRLPLPAGEMPTGLTWTRDGTLLFASLKGRALAARDTNGDGLEDALTPLSDDLATPYGLQSAKQAGRDVIDVITKPALVRLHDDDQDGFYERQEIVADGWGHTDDYHDWAVGLPKTSDGGYYVALPCQQDDRDLVKARLRGQGLKLTPREPTKDDPRRFKVEPFCGGLRFPMGLAVDKAGRLFATDNQGNYNPFNELNHLQPGKRFGFINKLERTPDFNPPVESPAIDIPHPWTRSVNGICFLDTPPGARTSPSAMKNTNCDHFGPFEGHLVGCEFNGRVLIRMSLEEVDGVMQGAAYPFSQLPNDPNAPVFEGPNVVAVAPDGDLYVGSLLDSGWGGGQNTGSIYQITPSEKGLPLGIAEVRAMPDGFIVRFTGKVEKSAAIQPANFSIEKYRRESTPQYGGDDIDRSSVRIQKIEPSADGREVRLRLGEMKAGFTYEFHLADLTANDALFFPAEAHYTLKRVPK